MGVSKIRPIRFTLPKALKYVMNPDKTDGQTLVSAFQCSPDADTAAEQFKMTAQLAERINHEKEELKEIHRKLAGVSNNVNQIARIANSTRSIYKSGIDELMNQVGEIRSMMLELIRLMEMVENGGRGRG